MLDSASPESPTKPSEKDDTYTKVRDTILNDGAPTKRHVREKFPHLSADRITSMEEGVSEQVAIFSFYLQKYSTSWWKMEFYQRRMGDTRSSRRKKMTNMYGNSSSLPSTPIRG